MILNKRFLFLIFILPAFSYAQESVELTISAGITVVNIDNLVEIDEISGTYASDWGLMNTGISAQCIIASKNNIGFGAEIMYQYLYWYSVTVPYGYTNIYREYSVSTFRLAPIARFGINKPFSFDIGPELNVSNGLKLGLLLSANFNIPVSDKVEVPIKLRTDIINNIVLNVPLSLNLGVRYSL